MLVLLIEDDILWRSHLLQQLNHLGYSSIDVCDSFNAAETYLKNKFPDLIIADVLLHDKPVFELFTSNSIFQIPAVFVTSSESHDFYQQSKQFINATYLVKPFHAISLQAAIDKVSLLKTSKSATDYPGIIVRGIYHEKITLHSHQILFIKSEKNYCIIKTPNSQFALKGSLQLLLNQLGPGLMQVHRSFLVNRNHIKDVNLYLMELSIEQTSIPIGNTYKEIMIQFLNETRVV